MPYSSNTSAAYIFLINILFVQTIVKPICCPSYFHSSVHMAFRVYECCSVYFVLKRQSQWLLVVFLLAILWYYTPLFYLPVQNTI